jgi:predicted small secreted protein
MKKLIILFALMITAVTTFTGCRHTARGAGEDIERAGEKIQEKTR